MYRFNQNSNGYGAGPSGMNQYNYNRNNFMNRSFPMGSMPGQMTGMNNMQMMRGNGNGNGNCNGNGNAAGFGQCRPNGNGFFYSGPPNVNNASENAADIGGLLKFRLLSENRFYLNKSNTKWISIGILPGYEPLNGTGFTTEIRIAGDNGKYVSLGQPAKDGLENLFAICRNIILPGSAGAVVNSTGIVVNCFPNNNTMCYNIMRNNECICLGHASIEGLVQMSHFLTAYLEKLNVAEIEASFLKFMKDKDIEKMLEKASTTDIDLQVNFADFVHVCMELDPEPMGLQQLVVLQQQPPTVGVQQLVPPQQQVPAEEEVNEEQPPAKKAKSDRKNAANKL